MRGEAFREAESPGTQFNQFKAGFAWQPVAYMNELTNRLGVLLLVSGMITGLRENR